MSHCRTGLSFVLLLVLPVCVQANAAAPWKTGQPVGEPTGLRAVRIERETLNIDLRALTTGGPAVVAATYQINNAGESVTTDLIFVSASLIGERAGVWLDDQPVPHERDARPELPPPWQPPQKTPALGEGSGYPYHLKPSQGMALAFHVTLSPGPHTLRVQYDAQANAYSGESPTCYWQLGYVLAPARAWGGFGILEVKVTLPAGWSAASEPPLNRTDDELLGTFQGIPADALALTVQAPPRTPGWLLTLLSGVSVAAALVGGPLLIWRLSSAAGRSLARSGSGLGWHCLLALGAGACWCAALVLTGFLITLGISSLAAHPQQAAWNHGYGLAWGFVFAVLGSVLLAPAGSLLSLVASYRAGR